MISLFKKKHIEVERAEKKQRKQKEWKDHTPQSIRRLILDRYNRIITIEEEIEKLQGCYANKTGERLKVKVPRKVTAEPAAPESRSEEENKVNAPYVPHSEMRVSKGPTTPEPLDD